MSIKFTAIILAAGMGTRLGSLTKDKPKALTEVAGKPIVHYSISFARKLGAEKIVVVGGYLFDKLKEAVLDIDKDVEVIENNEFQTTQRLVSLLKAKKEISGGFVSYDGDYIYHPEIAEKVKTNIDNKMKIFGTSVESDEVQLDMMVKVDKAVNLINMAKGLDDYEYYFNSIFYCPENYVNDFFQSANKILEKRDPSNTHVEEAIIEYALNKGKVSMVDLGYPKWIEIDTPEEREIAVKILLRENGFSYK
jgi:choline kinase